MKEKKNIDRLFQEKFKDFEKDPSETVWSKIETSLKEKKADRVLPIWWKLAGVAAALIAILVLGNLLLTSNSDNDNDLPLVEANQENDTPLNSDTEDINVNSSEGEVVNSSDLNRENNNESNSETNSSVAGTNQKERNFNKDKFEGEINQGVSENEPNDIQSKSYQNKIESSVAAGNKRTESSNIAAKNEKRTAIAGDSKVKDKTKPHLNNAVNAGEKSSRVAENSKEAETSSKDPLENKLPNQAQNNSELKNKEAIADLAENKEQKDDLKNAIAQVEDIEKEKDDDEKLNRWNVAPNVSPVYFNTLGSGSSLDRQFNENTKTGEVTFSYGINGSYAFNEKLKIRIGVNKLDLGYTTNDVIAFSGVNSRARSNTMGNIEFANQSSDQTYISSVVISNLVAQPNVLAINPKGSIDQEFGYIEVPVEIEYTLLDKKIDLNLIGGFSTLFLDRNEIYGDFQGERILLGKATNINETSYSANLGFGVNYNFSKSLDLSLEPTFKYQINTFENTSGDFRPYFIGFYSGIRFKF